MLAVNEIFYSIQGEGAFAGVPMIFIRLAGCNLRCEWCDQPDTIADDYTDSLGKLWNLKYTKMSETEIMSQLTTYPCHTVCLTGGEPTVHKLDKLVRMLKEQGYEIHIETNGTLNPAWMMSVDYITCSPKRDTVVALKRVHELKYIVDEQFDHRSLLPVYGCSTYLQPANFKDRVDPVMLQKALELVKQHPWLKLSVQLHKLIGVK